MANAAEINKLGLVLGQHTTSENFSNLRIAMNKSRINYL